MTRDGSHQIMANEIGGMQRYRISPVVLVLNNGLFEVEEFLEKNESRIYNSTVDWKYANGCIDFFCIVKGIHGHALLIPPLDIG